MVNEEHEGNMLQDALLPSYVLCGAHNRFDLWISKQFRRLAFKMMYVQFCNEAKSCAYWLVNQTLRYETETRPRHLIFSLRRDRDRDLSTFPQDRDETETFGNYISRPSRDRDVETETTSLVANINFNMVCNLLLKFICEILFSRSPTRGFNRMCIK